MSELRTCTEFRWRFSDDAIGEQWSAWHQVEGECSACCCWGPLDGEHQEAAEYDEDGSLTSGHTRLDPADVDEGVVVERRTVA